MIRFETLPPRLALLALLTRGGRLEPSFAWQEIYAQIHAAMFTVAKSTGHDILAEVFDALVRALEEGRTFEDFAKELKPLLVRKGWWGRSLQTDPQTGQPGAVQLGSTRRLRTIFDVNMRVSYAAGHWSNFERNKATRPFLRYVAIRDDRTRPEHLALHNLVLPVDHPFWDVFAPPNGWNCRCTLQALSQADVDSLLAKGERLIFDAPRIETRLWRNKRTGEERAIPFGIDPGWDYNPGKSGFERIRAHIDAQPEIRF